MKACVKREYDNELLGHLKKRRKEGKIHVERELAAKADTKN